MKRQILIYLFVICCISESIASNSESMEVATVKSDSLVVYEEMSTTSTIVKHLKKGDVVRVELEMQGSEGTWCLIIEEGQATGLGYVLCESLDRPEQKSELVGPSIVEMPSAASTPLAQGWNLHQNIPLGFAIALPPTWKVIDMDPKTMDTSIKKITKNPDEIGFLTNFAHNRYAAGVHFFAFDVSSTKIIIWDNAGIEISWRPLKDYVSLDEIVQAGLKRFKQRGLPPPTSNRRVNLAIGEVQEIKSISENENAIATTYLIVKGKDYYVITFGALADKAEKYDPIFWEIAQSFKLLK